MASTLGIPQSIDLITHLPRQFFYTHGPRQIEDQVLLRHGAPNAVGAEDKPITTLERDLVIFDFHSRPDAKSPRDHVDTGMISSFLLGELVFSHEIGDVGMILAAVNDCPLAQ